MTDFKLRTAVLTGAGSGFGLECARLAVDAGMHVVLVDVQADALERARREIGERAAPHGTRVAAHRVDVSSAEQMDALGAAVQRDFGAPAFVFNNAGVTFPGLIWEATTRDWDWVFGVNLHGVAHGVRVFTPMMLAAAEADPSYRGHIVNTASMAGLTTAPIMGLYAASKHAVVALSEVLFHDLALVTDRVRAHLLCPYFVATNMHVSDRNRPTVAGMPATGQPLTRSQELARALSEQQVLQGGTVTAPQVAQMVFDAMQADRFYIHTNPDALAVVTTRAADIAASRQPRDPFDTVNPARSQALRAALRAG
jgi:NAD(P)-dependent dehydrogenase (short-subunit alcohol dehydrogenase family)